jgi:ribokinase
MSVVIYGSINTDLITYTPKLPQRGETLLGNSYLMALGGKGANQAVAAAKLGADVSMVGHVGDDTFGRQVLEQLTDYGVDVSNVEIVSDQGSGLAVISVDDNGENTIIVLSGANMQFDQKDVSRTESLFDEAKVLLLQLEVPVAADLAVARAAHSKGIKVVLDPAPAAELPAELYSAVDILTPNEVETEMMVGIRPSSQQEAAEAAKILQSRGVHTVIVTLGSEGVFCASGARTIYIPAFDVDTIDTVGSGDAFNGGLAAAISEGMEIDEALEWGAAAGALSTTRSGAAGAMPDRAELISLISSSR